MVCHKLQLAWSAFLFVCVPSVVNLKKTDSEKTGVELHYLLYNMAVTLVWLVESAANFCDYKIFRHRRGESIPLSARDAEVSREDDKFEGKSTEECFLLIETAVAAYFTFDSMSVVFDMTKKNIHRESKGMMLDCAINTVAYGYMIFRHRQSKSNNTGVDPTQRRRIEELNTTIAELKQQNRGLLGLLEKEMKKGLQMREDSKEKKRKLETKVRTMSEKLLQLKAESIHDSDEEAP